MVEINHHGEFTEWKSSRSETECMQEMKRLAAMGVPSRIVELEDPDEDGLRDWDKLFMRYVEECNE